MHALNGAAPDLSLLSVPQWEFEPLVVVPLVLTGALYAAGISRLWRRAGIGRGVGPWSVASFAAGWVTTTIALISPVAWISRVLFSMHMTQHTMLMLLAAPLLAFGHPVLACFWGLPPPPRQSIGRRVVGRRFAAGWHALSSGLSVFLIQAVTLWIWHIPSWYE